jgi:hypothetical protein
MVNSLRILFLCGASFPFLLAFDGETASGQEVRNLFPDRSLMPALLAGPRDPATSASLFFVGPNPNAHGDGIEVEVSIGTTFPILLFPGKNGRGPVVVGIEAAAFARFGLQVLEREFIASDWVFAVPVVWHREGGWLGFGTITPAPIWETNTPAGSRIPGSTSPGTPQRSSPSILSLTGWGLMLPHGTHTSFTRRTRSGGF